MSISICATSHRLFSVSVFKKLFGHEIFKDFAPYKFMRQPRHVGYLVQGEPRAITIAKDMKILVFEFEEPCVGKHDKHLEFIQYEAGF